MNVIYELFRWIGVITGYPFYWFFLKTKYYYENPERKNRRIPGGALIISNHFNPLDFVQNVFVFFPRKLWVVASEDAFRFKLQSFGMKFWGGIMANRKTKSMRFIADSVKQLQKGNLVQIFPEGHNTPDGTIKEFYPSYVMIALRAKTPIVPVISDGAYGFRKRVHIMFGEPIDVQQYYDESKKLRQNVDDINEIIHNKVLQLREELDVRIQEEKKGKSK